MIGSDQLAYRIGKTVFPHFEILPEYQAYRPLVDLEEKWDMRLGIRCSKNGDIDEVIPQIDLKFLRVSDGALIMRVQTETTYTITAQVLTLQEKYNFYSKRIDEAVGHLLGYLAVKIINPAFKPPAVFLSVDKIEDTVKSIIAKNWL